MVTEGATCIDCHQNLVHTEAPMTDLNASLASGKLVLKPEEDASDDEEDEDDEEASSGATEAKSEASDDDEDDEDE